MAELVLEVSRREDTGKSFAKRLRRGGKVPAVVYGGHREPVPIVVDQKTVSELVIKSEHGVRSVFLLKMAGSDQQRHAMIKELQIDPISRTMTHIDFVRVVMDEKVKVTIPVHLVGTAIGVKTGGGVVDFQVREVHVECLPGSIPDTIDVDITPLELHGVIRISELKMQEGVKIFDDPDRVVVGITHARAEISVEVAAEVVEEAPAEPELIKKGKTEEEE
jgi:ribosomal protein L25, Ctc-form